MNWLDVVVLLVVAGGVFSGLKNGFVGEIASLAGLVLGIWGAIRFSDWMIDLMQTLGIHFQHMNVVAFVVTFLLITIICQVVASLVGHLLDALLLGWANKLAGIGVGVIKSVLFVGVVFYVFEIVEDRATIIPANAKQNSMLYEPLSEVIPTILPFFNFEYLKRDGESLDSGIRT